MSTSKLQREVSRLLSIHLGGYTIRENTRPDWLTFDGVRVELDFYIEELAVAIEVQGEQHYHYVPMFHHNADGFKKRIECDEQKRVTCAKYGVMLYEVSTLEDIYPIIDNLSKLNTSTDNLKFTQLLKRDLALKKRYAQHLLAEPKKITKTDIRKANKEEKKRLIAARNKAVRQERRREYYNTISKKLVELAKRWLTTKYNDPDLERIEKRIASYESHMEHLESLFSQD